MEEEFIILNNLIINDLQLDESEALTYISDTPDLNFFHQKLTQLIRHLLDHDMYRLLNAMYRLDVSEAKFSKAMHSPDRDEAARSIASLVLEREMQKVKTRLHYKKHRKF
ncbi:MAG: hypothetical protein RQ761_02635 [Bacteroidales bacterium]|nr:hypothetical protein [Bacteroidales bacterium]